MRLYINAVETTNPLDTERLYIDAVEQIVDLGLYYLYTNPAFYDLIADAALQVNLDAGRYPGNVGEDVATIVGGKLNTCGAYVQLVKKSEDISDGVWFRVNSPTITATTITALAQLDRVFQGITTTDSTEYTFSFIASVESGGQTTNYKYFHADSETGGSTALTLTETPTRYEVTVLGNSGGGLVYFGFQDNNTSNWAKVTITDFQVTETSSRMPYAANDSAISTLSVPANNSSNDGTQHGYFYTFADHPEALEAFDGTADNAEMHIPWTPKFDYGDVVAGNFAILDIDGTGGFGLLYHNHLGQIKSYDGVNTAVVTINWMADTDYLIKAIWGTHPTEGANKMQIIVEDISGLTGPWESSVVDFDGSFNLGDYFSIAWENDYWQEIGPPKIYKEIQHEDWLP